jgi:hypothetical protein
MFQQGPDRGLIASPSLNVHTQRYTTHPPPAVQQFVPLPSAVDSIEIIQGRQNLDRLLSRITMPGSCPAPASVHSIAPSARIPSLRPQDGQIQSIPGSGPANSTLLAQPRTTVSAYAHVKIPNVIFSSIQSNIDRDLQADEFGKSKQLCFNFVKGICKDNTCPRLHPSTTIISKICVNSLGKSRCQNKDCRLLHDIRGSDVCSHGCAGS